MTTLQKKFEAPTPRKFRILSLILKGVAIAATIVLPPLGVITVPVGAGIAGAAIFGSTLCSFASKSDLDGLEEILDKTLETKIK